MGTLLTAGYEGQTAGVTPTLANSTNGGDAALSVAPVVGSGGAITYDATNPAHGTKGLKVVTGSGAATYMPYAFAAANGTANIRFYFYYTGPPTTAELPIAAIYNGATTATQIILNTSGTVRLRDFASASPGISNGGSWSALTTNTMYRFELQLIAGTGTTDGTIHFAYYVGDSTTAVNSYDITTGNTGTATYTKGYFGRPSGATAAAYTHYYDDIALQEGMAATSFIGPYTTGTPAPVVTPPAAASYDGGTSVTLTFTATNTPTSWNWTQTAGTTVTLSGTNGVRTFTTPQLNTGDTLTFSVTATNAGGTSSAATVTITVYPWMVFVFYSGIWNPTGLVYL